MTRIYGLHKMIFTRKNNQHDKPIYFCVMNNVFNTSKEIHVRYDLKGSSQGRTTKFKNGDIDRTVALKDNDIVKMGEYFVVGNDYKVELMKQIEKDVEFFTENNLLDYSFLIGIHNLKDGKISRSSIS